jgi:hypothetical protein
MSSSEISIALINEEITSVPGALLPMASCLFYLRYQVNWKNSKWGGHKPRATLTLLDSVSSFYRCTWTMETCRYTKTLGENELISDSMDPRTVMDIWRKYTKNHNSFCIICWGERFNSLKKYITFNTKCILVKIKKIPLQVEKGY